MLDNLCAPWAVKFTLTLTFSNSTKLHLLFNLCLIHKIPFCLNCIVLFFAGPNLDWGEQININGFQFSGLWYIVPSTNSPPFPRSVIVYYTYINLELLASNFNILFWVYGVKWNIVDLYIWDKIRNSKYKLFMST